MQPKYMMSAMSQMNCGAAADDMLLL